MSGEGREGDGGGGGRVGVMGVAAAGWVVVDQI